MLGLDPAVHRVLHVEHGASVGTATHSAEGNAQRIGHGVGQATIGAGRQVEQMDTAIEQKLFELPGSSTASSGIQGIVLKEAIAEQAVAFEHAPGEQRPHVEGTNPGQFENVLRQIEAQLGAGEALGLVDEIGFVLQRRNLLEQGNNPIKAALDLLLVGLKTGIRRCIRQRMAPMGDRQRAAAQIERNN